MYKFKKKKQIKEVLLFQSFLEVLFLYCILIQLIPCLAWILTATALILVTFLALVKLFLATTFIFSILLPPVFFLYLVGVLLPLSSPFPHCSSQVAPSFATVPIYLPIIRHSDFGQIIGIDQSKSRLKSKQIRSYSFTLKLADQSVRGPSSLRRQEDQT